MVQQRWSAVRKLAGLTALVASAAFSGGVLRAETACDATALNGAYSFKLNGYVYDRQGYSYFLAGVGVATADGAGNVSGTETMSFDGSIVKRKFTGTYAINSDCTGSFTFNYGDSSVFHADVVVTNDAKEVSVVQTDSGFIYSGEWKKQKTTQTQTQTTTPPTENNQQ